MNRYRFPIALLILSALTFGLFITASPTPDAQAAPRTIPWDCSDWQETPAVADAADARVSMILESLAANRGKSIYCAVDQSDTWTKSETWLAGRDRNERDDTVYFGEQGNFRGFLAAQEGYLTDGESGVTGISRDRIFEFPEEPRRGKKTVRFRVRSQSADTGTCPDDAANPGNLLCTPYAGAHGSYDYPEGSQARSRVVYSGQSPGTNRWRVHWRTNARQTWDSNGVVSEAGTGGGRFRSPEWWTAQAEALAPAACRARGGKYVEGSADFGRGHNRDNGRNQDANGDYHGWFYSSQPNQYDPSRFQSRARESRTWVAVCTKRVRRR